MTVDEAADGEPLSWQAAGRERSLAAIRAYVLEVAADLDPGSRYVRELLATLDAAVSVEDYLRRLADPDRAARFRRDGSGPSGGERGFSWVDDAVWVRMDPYEQTLSNLLTGETRMMWAGDGALDFARLPEVLGGLPAPRRLLSVPCSTGKEPYSLVIAALEAGYDDVTVDAVDRQAAYLERARSGVLVPHGRDRDHPAAARYLEPTPSGGTRVSAAVLDRCRFAPGDVLTGELPAGPYSLVSCRNLLGYFRGASLEAALTHVTARVAPGGVLLVDPFVTDGAEMAAARAFLARAGLARRWEEASYYDRRA